MIQPKIWLSSPHMGGAEQKYVQEAFDTNWVAPLGANVDGFQRDLQDFTGARHAAVLISGTAARIFWLTAVTIDPVLAGCGREAVRLRLLEENIESRPLWKPMHLQPVFRDAPALVNGTSEALFEKGLCLPSGSNMTDDDMERIHKALNKIFGR